MSLPVDECRRRTMASSGSDGRMRARRRPVAAAARRAPSLAREATSLLAPLVLTAVLTVSAGSSRRRHQPSSSSSSSWEVGAAFAAEGFPGAPAWDLCVPHGCADVDVTNDSSHAYPWLASIVSLTFLAFVAAIYFLIGSDYQSELVRVRPGTDGGG